MIKNKLGVSGMIGYVLLIGIVMAIAGFMYIFLRSYVPQEEVTCPDGGSISVLKYTCTFDAAGKYKLNITLKNSGRFDLYGYSIYATKTIEQEIATSDLSKYFDFGSGSGATQIDGTQNIYFVTGDVLPTSESIIQIFEEIPYDIFSVDITPLIEVETEDNRLDTAICGDAKIKENIECVSV